MKLHINSYGTYVHVKDEIFEIKIPQENGETIKKYFSPKKISGIVLSTAAAISTDALALALKYNIDVVVLDEFGKPLGRFWHSKLGSTTLIRRKQLQLENSRLGVRLIADWLIRKNRSRNDFLRKMTSYRKKKSEYILEQIEKIKNQTERLKKIDATKIQEVEGTIRGLEGTSGRIYFQTLSNLLAEEYRFEGRTSRPAKDKFNAFLNYAYGVLYSRIEKALIIAGLDPFVGILHRDDYNHKSMVYDFIEPYRIFAEKPVFQLFSAKKVAEKHVDKLENGVVLNQEGKKLLLEKFIKYIDEEKVRYKNKNHTRNSIIQMEAHQLAQKILNS